MSGTGNRVTGGRTPGERGGRHRAVVGRVGAAAALAVCAVPVVMVLNVVSTWTFSGPDPTTANVRVYELLLVASPVLVVVAVVAAVRSGVRWPAFVALTMVPVVLVAAYLLALPEGRWSDLPSLQNDTPACWSGTDSCAESGG